MSDASPAERPDPASMPYAEAMEELERILEELEGESVDVDALASHVRRASELIKSCRLRLTSSRTEIEQVVSDLEAFEQESAEGEG